MAKNFARYGGGVLVTGGIEPAGNFPVVESKYVMVKEDGTTLADVLGDGSGSISDQINVELASYSTTAQVKAFNDMANYYTKTQMDAASGTGAKVDKSAVQSSLSASSTNEQVPSAKATYDAIENAKSAAANNKIASVTSGSTVPVTSGAVYSEFQNYYTKDEANENFYVAIVINSSSLSKGTFEQGDTAKTATFSWSTNTLAVSAKISVGGGAATETITSGQKKNSGTYTVTVDTDSVGSNGSKTVAVKVDVKDAFDGTASKSVNATVCNNVIIGGAVKATSSNGATVLSDANMSAKFLQTSKALGSAAAPKSATVQANKYFTLAIPSAYGTPSKFNLNGSDIALPKIASNVAFTNGFGKTVNYDIYQNNQAPNANTTYSFYCS